MKNVHLRTKDGIKIELSYYNKGFDSVVIIAPGWCMTKDSKSFVEISNSFSNDFDVISFDFRGHGKSSGFYTFGAKEEAEIDEVIKFAKSKGYKKVFIIGFSLGAMIALQHQSKHNNANRAVFVSVPCDFDKIENKMWKKEAWGETFKKFELSRFLSVRPYLIPLKKEKPVDCIKELKIPSLFIAGKKDPTVCFWHTEKLYNLAECEKDFVQYENGIHAEDLFLYDRRGFYAQCINWFKKD